MRLDAVLPDESPRIEPDRLIALGVQAERSGYGAVWLPDHLLPPEEFGARYGGVYEPLILLTAIAAATERIEVGTSVLILPLRHPVLVAKQVATMERLAPGRVLLGVGIGWDRQEFAALRSDYATRAARTDEALRLIRHLFDHGRGPFEGVHYGFEHGVFAPQPESHVPIVVGGVSEAALRRAVRSADVWQGFGLDPDGFAERRRRLHALGGDRLRLATRIAWDDDARDVTEVVGELERFRAAGADQVAVWFGTDEGVEERMARLAGAWGDVEP